MVARCQAAEDISTLDRVTRDLDVQIGLINSVIHFATVAKKDFAKAAKLMTKDAESKARDVENKRKAEEEAAKAAEDAAHKNNTYANAMASFRADYQSHGHHTIAQFASEELASEHVQGSQGVPLPMLIDLKNWNMDVLNKTMVGWEVAFDRKCAAEFSVREEANLTPKLGLPEIQKQKNLVLPASVMMPKVPQNFNAHFEGGLMGQCKCRIIF